MCNYVFRPGRWLLTTWVLIALFCASVHPLPAQGLDDALTGTGSPVTTDGDEVGPTTPAIVSPPADGDAGDGPTTPAIIAPPDLDGGSGDGGPSTPPSLPGDDGESGSATATGSDTGDAAIEAMRARIVELADGEVGKVDCRPQPDGFKKGWERIKLYYEVAYGLKDLAVDRPYWLKMIKKPNARIEGGPKHWCGIFTTWAWRTAGMPVEWDARVKGAKYRGDRSNLQPGDICIVAEPGVPPAKRLWHHCIIKSRDGDRIVTINGNSLYQGVTLKNQTIGEMEVFYSVSDTLGKVLPKGSNVYVAPPVRDGGSGAGPAGGGAGGSGSGGSGDSGGAGGVYDTIVDTIADVADAIYPGAGDTVRDYGDRIRDWWNS